MQGPVAIILISWNVIFIWETGYWTRGTYKVRNEIETKRNETKSTKTKRNQQKRNETKRNQQNENEIKRNQRKQNEINENKTK
jgi:Flp pilus assembly protein TadB